MARPERTRCAGGPSQFVNVRSRIPNEDVSVTMKTTKQRPPAQKAAAENAVKREQHAWLRHARAAPPQTPPTPERTWAANLSPRLLDKAQVCAITNVTYPTLWTWMRSGRFPRARIVGGKSMWLSDEVEAWLATLPVRPLKGDEPLEVA